MLISTILMCTIVTVAIISNNQWNKASFFLVIFQRLNHRPDFVVRDSWCFGWSQLLGWSDAGRATDWLSLGQPIWRGKSQNPCDCDCDVVGNSSEFVGMVFKRWLGTWEKIKNGCECLGDPDCWRFLAVLHCLHRFLTPKKPPQSWTLKRTSFS